MQFAAKYETFDLYRLWDQVNANRLVILLSFAMWVARPFDYIDTCATTDPSERSTLASAC